MTVAQCGHVDAAVRTLAAAGRDARLVNVSLAGTPTDLAGCGSHPTTADHAAMADIVAPAIAAATGWEFAARA